MIHHGTLRLRTNGAQVSSEAVARAKRCVGIAKQAWAFQKPGHLFRPFRFADGLEVDVMWDGTLWIATVREPAPGAEPLQPSTRSTMWIPRGFVVWPVSSASPLGWGAPSTPVDDDPYHADNVRPGLDTNRWTAGGALGQVLLTRVPGGGYPDEDERPLPPLLFHREVGPRPAQDEEGAFVIDLPPESGGWSGYRLEFAPYRSNSVADSANATFIAAWKRDAYAAVNAYRVSIGRQPLLLPIRGWHDSGQVTADLMHSTQVMGHDAEAYPETYRSMVDRLTKSGITALISDTQADSRNTGGSGLNGENLHINSSTVPVQIGVDSEGFGIFSYTTGPQESAQAVLDSWLNSPRHLEVIESPLWDHGTSFVPGYAGSAAAQHFVGRGDWILAGNRVWHSDDPRVPALSWFGPPALNLAFETYPVRWDTAAWVADGTPLPGSPGYRMYLRLDVATFSVDGVAWFQVHTAQSSPSLPWYQDPAIQPALSCLIFARGRAIAAAPRGGLVWAAAVQAHEGMHRLVALVHDESVQLANPVRNGLTATLSIWYCDIPDLDRFLLNPETVIRGIYGEEDEGYPWDQVNNPYSWRPAGTVDVGSSNGDARDLLLYLSQWTFDRSGQRAVCLRSSWTADTLNTAVGQDIFAFIASREWFRLDARALTLDLSVVNSPVLDVSPVLTSSYTVPESVIGDAYNLSGLSWLVRQQPAAIGYTDDGELDLCWHFTAVRSNSTGALDNDQVLRRDWSGWGGMAVTLETAADMHLHVLQPEREGNETDRTNKTYLGFRLNVLSIQSHTVLAIGIRNWVGQFTPVPNTSLRYYAVQAMYCWVDDPTKTIFQWSLHRGANTLGWAWFASEGGVAHTAFAFCRRVVGAGDIGFGALFLPLNANLVLPVWAEDRAGRWVISVLQSPQPYGAHRANFALSPDQCSAPFFAGAPWGGPTGCGPSVRQREWLDYDTADAIARRPLFTAASIGDLAALTQTPGSGFRLLQARVV